jgi:uncharacterized protein (TIGR01440 family)
MSEDFLADVSAQVRQATEELLAQAKLEPGQIVVLGCSSSEVGGHRIGSAGSTDVARAILTPLMAIIAERGLRLAVQCCEHLNRALVVERETMNTFGLDQVSVVPVPHAGGATAATAMELFHDPVVVEEIKAHAGLDIGSTLIGMHLKRVAVPVRLSLDMVGAARLTAARTRPKLIGGERAVYVRVEQTQSGRR